MSGFDCYIRTKEDLIQAINEYGFVPFFINSISGFSIEEHIAPECWYNSLGDSMWPAWDWKGPVIKEAGCAYGKFFERLCHNKQLINSHFCRGASKLPYKLKFVIAIIHPIYLIAIVFLR